jgi:mannosyltransferase OCH1-like enzyme
VPKSTSKEVETWWEQAGLLHPDWEHVTLRDPIDPADFPLTSPSWPQCESGAQFADLIRAEELYLRGGVYIDSDVEVLRPFDPLLGVKGFLGWEDTEHICNAVMGFEDNHFGLAIYIETALKRLSRGTWASGVGTITEVFRHRLDTLLLPPQCFYPMHYRSKHITRQPWSTLHWSFATHHWLHSWSKE